MLEHASKLVFPSGTTVSFYSGREAEQKSLELINISKDRLRSFILTFEPTSYTKTPADCPLSQQVLSLVNPEKRVYAVCMQLEDFTVVEEAPTAV